MYVVVSYDIIDDKRRNKIAKALLCYGRRVQKSVFECLLEEKHFLEMKTAIESLIDFEKDSVRYYFLCKKCVPAIEISGWGTVSEEEKTIII